MDLFSATQPFRARRYLRYSAAFVTPLIAFGLRLALGGNQGGFPFLAFFPAVLITSFLGGWDAGLLATAFSAWLVEYFLINPASSFGFYGSYGWIGLAAFLAISAVIIGLVQLSNHTMAQLSAAGDRLRRLNEDLEERIAERTQALALANGQLREEIMTREKAEAQVRQAQKMDAIGQLTGGVAHDFNNMLAVIVGCLEMANFRLVKGNYDISKLLDNALEGATKAGALTQRLLAFARQQPLSPVATNVNGLVQGMAELLTRTIGGPIVLECVLGAGLWQTRVDRGQLESAILNLAINARDAMPNGGRLTIETHNTYLDQNYSAANADVMAGQYVVVAVSDTGSGMSPEVAARAFDPFFTTKDVGRGTGLGLSQVYGFVKQSEGHVKIYTEQGHGTTVKIYLRRDTSADRDEQDKGLEATALPSGTPKEIILVVEDEEGVRLTSVGALRELGYTVRHASSGNQALEMLDEQPGIKLLFTDVVMPGMTGRQLADKVLERRPDLKVLYTTGYTRNAIIHNGVVDPGVEVLMKPFGFSELARRVRTMLDRDRAD